VFNPTETKKNGPAGMPASTPARRSASPFTAGAVLPATSKSYGDARDIVNGDHRRWLLVRRDSTATLPRVAVQVRQQVLDALDAGQARRVRLNLGMTFGGEALDEEHGVRGLGSLGVSGQLTG
jgi:hypothetical protein